MSTVRPRSERQKQRAAEAEAREPEDQADEDLQPKKRRRLAHQASNGKEQDWRFSDP